VNSHPRVLIVGTGIVGASIAWHLARDGARVTMIDAGEPGGVATRNSWAWINASWGNPEPYFRLRVHAMREWRRLQREVPGVRVAWVGGLFWELPPEQLERFLVQHTGWDYPLRPVTREQALALEPSLATPPERALHAAHEGVVEPLGAALALLAAAREHGASIIAGTRARSLILSGDIVTGVETDHGRLYADEVIVAAGVGTEALMATAGVAVPMLDAPAIVVATAPCPRCLNGLLIAPDMELRQTEQGRLLAVGRFDADRPDQDGALAAAALFGAIRRAIVSGASLSPEYHVVAHRPMPRDRLPVIGRANGVSRLYCAVTHSGITLAPAIGRFVADEVLLGRRDDLLAPYGLDRMR